ncbi:restriction endonuclease subunit S [Candidatus Woesearchaeota archaeon]|nr:restriction endonuclease subunit S [Candidatus Woesearchaeota archaeon]MCF7859159.1 restriction endonuclease subunit S [Candidatus Cloacimonadota bacterium]MCF8012820.1 restriction endonuclease subunit S [Candidatus Woesearchaeota archaeon]
MASYKETTLNDKNYFKMFLGKRVLRKDIFQSNKDIPVISANVFQSMGFTDKTIIKNFDKEFIIWGIDGNFDFNHIKKGIKFMPTDHCGCLEIIEDKILPEYILYQLEENKKKYGFDRTLRSSLKNMSKFKIKIPLKKNNEIDVSKQKEIIEKYNLIKEIKKELVSKIEEIQSLKVNFITDNKYKILKISDIFDLSITTNRSFFTKDFINKNKGTIPVYSASKDKDSVDYGYVKDNLKDIKYFEDCLTWNIDGSVEKPHFRQGRFSLSEKVIPLIIYEKYKELLSIDFLKYEIEKEFSKKKFGFGHKAGKGRIKDIEIKIPVDKDKHLDFKKQKDIANKISKLSKIKNSIVDDINKLIEVNIDLK